MEYNELHASRFVQSFDRFIFLSFSGLTGTENSRVRRELFPNDRLSFLFIFFTLFRTHVLSSIRRPHGFFPLLSYSHAEDRFILFHSYPDPVESVSYRYFV